MNTKQHFLRIFFSLLGVSLIMLAVILFFPLSSPAAPVITWTPASVTETVSPGESKEVSVAFTSSEDVADVTVRVVPELEPFVKVTPASFSQITKGETINLNVIISAEQDSPLGSFDGTIKLRADSKKSKTFAKPLPVVVDIWQSVTEKGLSLEHPPYWQLNTAPLALGGPISLNNFDNIYEQGGIIPQGGAKIDITTIPLPNPPVSEIIAKELQGAIIESTTTRFVGGETGTEVIYSVTYTPTFTEKSIAIYIPHNEILYKIFLSYNAGDPNETEFINGFQQILDTIEFTQ